MQTSYFGYVAHLPLSQVVSIARGFPKYFSPEFCAKIPQAEELAPSWGMVQRGYTYDEYVSFLKRHGVTAQAVWSRYSDKIMLCHEKDGTHCHRRMLALWLERELGVSIKEVDVIEGVEGVVSPMMQLSLF
jgi:hypothetical protein